MRILVTGPRQWTDLHALQAGLDDIMTRVIISEYSGGITLVHGGAQGFDLMAAGEASERGWRVEKHEAEWGALGRPRDLLAGHRRNQEMVDAGADACLAGIMLCIKPRCTVPQPHPTHGTMDCVGRVLLAGIRLFPVRLRGTSRWCGRRMLYLDSEYKEAGCDWSRSCHCLLYRVMPFLSL